MCYFFRLFAVQFLMGEAGMLMKCCVVSVTIARAIELKHSSSLVSALAFETAQLYTTAGSSFYQFVPYMSSVCLFTGD